jgi:hypothetical protein
MRAVTSRPSAGLLYLVISGLLWGTGGLTGSLLGRVAGLSSIAVAAFRLTAGGVLIVCYLIVARRTWPAGRAAWARITVIGLLAALYQSCYFTAVALTSVPLATLITIGAAPVLVLAAERVTGRPARRPHHRPGRGRPRPARGPAVRVPRDRGRGQRGHGRARRGGLRRGHHGQLPAGARPGRPDRDRVRLHHRRPGPDAAGAASGRHRVPARARRYRPAGRAGHRPDRRGLHAVLPRPADRRGEHGRPAGPA